VGDILTQGRYSWTTECRGDIYIGRLTTECGGYTDTGRYRWTTQCMNHTDIGKYRWTTAYKGDTGGQHHMEGKKCTLQKLSLR
jgi:hypothetical protein